jgi:hypothetical protein
MGSFDAQSVGPTPNPAPTPPPVRPASQHQQQMTYALNGNSMNGMMPPQQFQGYTDSGAYAPATQQQPQPTPASYYLDGMKRQIYTVSSSTSIELSTDPT